MMAEKTVIKVERQDDDEKVSNEGRHKTQLFKVSGVL